MPLAVFLNPNIHLIPLLPKTKAPQQMKISLASTTGFWNELYFYRAKFIITEWSLFVLFTFFTLGSYYSTVTDFAKFLGLSTSWPKAVET